MTQQVSQPQEPKAQVPQGPMAQASPVWGCVRWMLSPALAVVVALVDAAAMVAHTRESFTFAQAGGAA